MELKRNIAKKISLRLESDAIESSKSEKTVFGAKKMPEILKIKKEK